MLYAIGESELEDSLVAVTFPSEKPEEARLVEQVEGDLGSETIFIKGSIFVIGGWREDLFKRVFTFDVVTGKKGRVADLQFGRHRGHSITTFSDEIFICGGHDRAGNKTCEAYHIHENRWRRLPDLRQGREFLAVTCLPDGRLVVTGGAVTSSCELLQSTSQSDAWRPVAPMRQIRSCHGAVCIEGRVYVTGGHTDLTSCEVFTPPPLDSVAAKMGQWTSILANMTRPFYLGQSLVALSANEMIAFGKHGEVECFKKNSTGSAKLENVEAWSCSALPAIRHLSSVCGVHSTN